MGKIHALTINISNRVTVSLKMPNLVTISRIRSDIDLISEMEGRV